MTPRVFFCADKIGPYFFRDLPDTPLQVFFPEDKLGWTFPIYKNLEEMLNNEPSCIELT